MSKAQVVKVALLVAAAILVACDPTHIAPYVQKHREYVVPESANATDVAESEGSLWRNGRAASMLFTDARALRANDLVVVKIEEVADAKRSADTDLSRNSQIQMELLAALQRSSAPGPWQIDAKAGSTLSTQFDGKGSTGRSDRLTATVPAIVRKVLPNGNLFIEGHRVVLVNSEEHHFYISGVVRPIDIDQENSVKSSMIADAEIEFTGSGVLTDNQHQGILQRLWSKIFPL